MQQARTIYPALTGLRFFAASVIFIFHNQEAVTETFPDILKAIVAEFHIGVSVFFVLSGFLIANQFSGVNMERPGAFFKYLAVRFVRIFPLYWLILIGLQLIWLFAIPEFIIHATLLKGYFRKFYPGVAQAWSLSVEIAFYAFAPFIYKAILSKKSLLAFLVVSLIGLGLWVIGSGLNSFGLNPYGFVPDLQFLAFNTFFGRATEFFAGMLLYYYVIHRDFNYSAQWFRATYLGIILLTLNSLMLHSFQTKDLLSVHTWGGLFVHHTAIPLAIVVIIYGLVKENTYLSQVLGTRLLLLLGNASYAFYLIHFGWIANWFNYNVSSSPVVLFFILWMISIVMYLAFDRPVYYFLRKKIMAL